MKTIIACFAALCLLACPIVVGATEVTEVSRGGDAVISTTVPETHTLRVQAEQATVLVDGASGTEFSVERLSALRVHIQVQSGYRIRSVYLNGTGVTEKLLGEYLTLDAMCEDATLVVTTEPDTALPPTGVYGTAWAAAAVMCISVLTAAATKSKIKA